MIEHLLEPDFAGTVGRTLSESTPWWPLPTTGAGRPNVIVVVLDDVGFAQLGCYGSDIETPVINGLAADGVRLNNFHVTPLCSPTRACLLTGRNHHTAGMSMITGFPSGFPNGREQVTKRAAMLPAHLRRADYGCYAVGKWHLGPMHEINPAGPFDHWPLAHGFDRFYGFLAGETDQYRPNLVRDNHVVHPSDDEDYHLSEELTDEAITMITTHRSASPHRPFFLYLAYGACHGPHQVPPPYRDTHAGRFDDGWDETRLRWYRRQLADGIIPAGTQLPPANPGLPSWDDVPAEHRPLFARYQELFAGFLQHTDAQIGRLIDALRRTNCLDDTVVVVVSDNGAAGEGGLAGSWNELIPLNGMAATPDESFARLDALGGPASYPIYPTAWAQAGNTPGKWYKHHTFGGGVRAPLIVRWPGRVATPGRVDGSFCHAIDLVPTLLELCDVEPTRAVDGIDQIPMHGVSMVPALIGCDTGGRRRTQYFEMGGHRGIYHDGWKATTMHLPGAAFEDEEWELYHLAEDFSEHRNLAVEEPARLRQLVDLWWHEAGRYGVTPLDDRFLDRALSRDGQPNEHVREVVLWRGTDRISEAAMIPLTGSDHSVRVTLNGRRADDDGVLVSFGGRFAGYVLYVADGELRYEHNGFGEVDVVSTPLPCGPDARVVGFDRETTTDGPVVHLVIDENRVASTPIRRVVPFYSGGNGIEVGENRLSPVSSAYAPPARYRGDFDAVTITLAEGTVVDGAGSAATAVRAD
ncbi:arylsulfatase [Desertimonas flava]|uniref:arylsulfatase n=1 Tax=Desertimonas flava TaxID=2064846 RepID=UPI0013C45458|nr:arylsulfatase [Desertimonas flava]